MSALELLTGAYIDANLLLAVALGLWLAIRAALTATGLSSTASSEQRLLRLGLAAALLTPLAVGALAQTAPLRGEDLLPALSLSDFLISQYLQGRLALESSALDALIGARERLAGSLWSADGGVASAAALALAAGAALAVLRLLHHVVRLRRSLAACHRWRRIGRLELLLSDRVAVPFATRSLRRKVIVVPSAMLCHADELRFAIAHEAQHLRNGDVVWEMLLQGLKPLFFWNPAFWIWKAQADRLRELACDRTVVQRKRFDVEAYCDVLLRTAERCRRLADGGRPTAPATPLAPVGGLIFGRRARQALRQRVLSLLDPRPARDRRAVHRCCGLALVGPLAVTALWLQPPATVSADRLHLSTIVNLERMAAIRSEPGYNLVMAY